MEREQTSSLVWLVLAVLIGIESLRLPLGAWRDPGPGFLPLITAILLAILSAVNILMSRRDKSERAAGRDSWYSKERWPKLVFVLAALFGYVLCLEFLGFLLATFLLLVFLFRGVEPYRWIVALGASALTSFLFYLVFELSLKVQLPKGIWGF